jgi:hypothetical protein
MRRLIPAVLLACLAGVLISLTPGAYAEPSCYSASFAQTGETIVVVNADTLNVREGPGTNYRVLDRVTRGISLVVLLRNDAGDWLQVRTPSRVVGWVSALYVASAQGAGALPNSQQAQPSASSGQSSGGTLCVARLFTPNSSTNSEGNIVECFGTGTTPLRRVAANTPVQVLGIGDYGTQDNEREKLGPGPYAKIRLWDGQYAWIAVSNLRVDAGSLPRVSSVCEVCDRIDWSSVVRPTPTPVPSRYQPPNAGGNRSGCCKICTTGKACGDTCINVNYTCHVGPGCACNG